MKRKYEKPSITMVEILERGDLLSGSIQSEDELCDCFAHRGDHSRCGRGCHNSGKQNEIQIKTNSVWDEVW